MSTSSSTPNLFLLYPEHEDFLTNQARRIKNPRLISLVLPVIIMWALCALFGWLLLNQIREYLTFRQLDAEGVSTTGTIIDASQKGGYRSPEYYITYQFNVEQTGNGQQTYTHEHRVSPELYSLGINSPVNIRYLPHEPTVSRAGSSQVNIFWLLLFSLIFLTLLLAPLFRVAPYRRKKQLERDGQVIMGVLQSCKGERIKAGYGIDVQYSLQTPDGRSVTGRQTSICNHLRKQPLPPPGTPIAVVYVNDKLHEML